MTTPSTERGVQPQTRAVSQLHAGSTGRWLVHSRGSVHVLDLDARTYERRPGPTSQHFTFDNSVVSLTRVALWPEVGGKMAIFFDDPDDHLLEHWRVSSRIEAIIADTPTSSRDRSL